MTDKRSQGCHKVKCKRNESTVKQSFFAEYKFFFRTGILVLLQLVRLKIQTVSIIEQEK